jgi:hypothetical protein
MALSIAIGPVSSCVKTSPSLPPAPPSGHRTDMNTCSNDPMCSIAPVATWRTGRIRREGELNR